MFKLKKREQAERVPTPIHGSFSDQRQYAPAVERNRKPILRILRPLLKRTTRILEVGSGTGEHAVYFAREMPHVLWQTSDVTAQSHASIRSWIQWSGVDNVSQPFWLDLRQNPWKKSVDRIWESEELDAVIAINVLHVAPREAMNGLLLGASSTLKWNGILYLYGPFTRDGNHTAARHAAFDRALRMKDPKWGVRDLESELLPLAEQHQLHLHRVIAMPNDNLSIVLKKRA